MKVCSMLSNMHAADLADDGTIRRRVSGRTRSGKLQHNPGQYTAAPLYTVVTMDPNDEVCHWQGHTILFWDYVHVMLSIFCLHFVLCLTAS